MIATIAGNSFIPQNLIVSLVSYSGDIKKSSFVVYSSQTLFTIKYIVINDPILVKKLLLQ